MRSPIFDQALQEQQTAQRWILQSEKMLRVVMGPEVIAAQGAMVAYQGNIDFAYQGARSLGGMIKKALTNEGGNLMRVNGQGEIFFARSSHNIFLIELEGDAITINTRSLLAFDSILSYDIRMMGNAGILSGGLFNLFVQGQGVAAISSHGTPHAARLLPAAHLRRPAGRDLLVGESPAAGQEHLQDEFPHRSQLGRIHPAGLPRPGFRRRPAERGSSRRCTL